MQNYVYLCLVASLILPANGGRGISDLEYSQGGNTWVSFPPNTQDDDRQMVRLGELMRSYLERGEERFREVMGIKKEISDQSVDQRRAFEMGYVMGDIIENYRKALVFTQKLTAGPVRYLEADRIRFMTYVQNAYIKVYHLAHMMHEINPKFGTDNTGQIAKSNLHGRSGVPTYYNSSGFYYTKELNAIRQARVDARNERIKKEGRMKDREMFKYGTLKPRTLKTTTNWWPIAYGWDIDYYW